MGGEGPHEGFSNFLEALLRSFAKFLVFLPVSLLIHKNWGPLKYFRTSFPLADEVGVRLPLGSSGRVSCFASPFTGPYASHYATACCCTCTVLGAGHFGTFIPRVECVWKSSQVTSFRPQIPAGLLYSVQLGAFGDLQGIIISSMKQLLRSSRGAMLGDLLGSPGSSTKPGLVQA